MSFFDYCEKVNCVEKFGIRDDEEGKEILKQERLSKNPSDSIFSVPTKELPAFIDYQNIEKWNAAVESQNRNDFNFIAVDNNVPCVDENGNEKSRCDAIIFTLQTIIFIEIKIKDRDWIKDASEQLKSTIEYFKSTENINNFKYKKAYTCNKQHPSFNFHHKEFMHKFFQETGVVLKSEMIIKDVK